MYDIQNTHDTQNTRIFVPLVVVVLTYRRPWVVRCCFREIEEMLFVLS